MRAPEAPHRPLADKLRFRRLGATFVAVLALGACGSDVDGLDEGPEPPEDDTEIVPGEEGPVD